MLTFEVAADLSPAGKGTGKGQRTAFSKHSIIDNKSMLNVVIFIPLPGRGEVSTRP
jgi:hypothetical protein